MKDTDKVPPAMGEIAERAGVNRSTVSRALRDDPRLKIATRRKIQALAAEMGYRRNATVAQLMTQLRAGRQNHFRSMIAVLNFGVNHTIQEKIWRGAEDRAQMLGYGLEILHVRDVSPQRLEQILVNRGIRGLILATLWGARRLPDEYRNLWDRFACCCLSIHTNNPELHFVDDDNFSTATAAVEKLAKMGFKRIGLALQRSINVETENRFVGGYLAACLDRSELEQIPVVFLEKQDEEKFLSWFREFNPQVVICIQEDILAWLAHAGIVAPKDVSLVHLDLDAVKSEGWAGMRQARGSRGAFAVDVVVSQINNNEMGPPTPQVAMLTESTWEPGATLAATKAEISVKKNAPIKRAAKRKRLDSAPK